MGRPRTLRPQLRRDALGGNLVRCSLLLFTSAAVACSKGERPPGSSSATQVDSPSIALPPDTEPKVFLPPLQDSAWAITRTETSYQRLDSLHSIGQSTTVFFANGSQLLTDLFDIHSLGQLHRPDAAPFLILAARGCTNCDINESIYIVSPTAGPFVNPRSERRFAYPGDLLTLFGDTLLETSRMFVGSCLPDRSPLVIWFHHFRADSTMWRDTVFLAEPYGDSLVSDFARSPLPDSAVVLAAVRSGTCYEVPGKTKRVEL